MPARRHHHHRRTCQSVLLALALAAGPGLAAAPGAAAASPEVAADLTITRADRWAAVGAQDPQYEKLPEDACDQFEHHALTTTVVGGSVTITDGTLAVEVAHLDVAGDLTCTGNAAGVVVAADVVVGGTRSGQCA